MRTMTHNTNSLYELVMLSMKNYVEERTGETVDSVFNYDEYTSDYCPSCDYDSYFPSTELSIYYRKADGTTHYYTYNGSLEEFIEGATL